MQYYQNGFRGGNPAMKNAAPNRRDRGPFASLPEKVDVLIAGAGPAGLCLAAQLAQFPEIETIIVERDPKNIEKGKADGINTRTMEMFQAFGFADQVKTESYSVNQTSFWMPDPDNLSHIKRIGRVQDVPDDSSEMPHILINQARLHQLFLDSMKNAPSRLEPDYGWAVVDLSIDPTTEDHPVTVIIEDTGVNWGMRKTIRANYVVGCDGARSTVRKAIGGELHGDAAHQAWGVMDILANTDFPDIRQKCLVASQKEGNILILPREGGYLFRMYVELDKLNKDERVSDRNFTQEDMIATANRILAPYTLDVKEVVWWSIYEISHRLSDRFDDVPPGEDRNPRVFTAGDACHTHSPKAGQGMNVSMQDTFNLGWKLAHVFQGRSDPSLLRSYSRERWVEAKRLIDTDHKWSRVMSAPPGTSELDGSGMPRIQKHFIENLMFTGGLAVQYDQSNLIAVPRYQHLARGQEVGKRFHSAPVVRVADAMQMQLGHCAEADGRWRIYAFSSVDTEILHNLASLLENAPDSPVNAYRRTDQDIDCLIDIRAIYQETFDQIDYETLPNLFKPRTGKYGLQNHEKVFCTDHKGQGNIFDMRGINRDTGCMIIVRPDQYIANILPLTAYQELCDFFGDIFIRQS